MHKNLKPRVGYFSCGLAAYWPQFPSLLPGIDETMKRHVAQLEKMGCEIVHGGLVDTADKGTAVGELFARERVDLIIGEIMTYTASHMLVPIAQRNQAPYLTLALQMAPTVPYDAIDTEELSLFGSVMTCTEVSNAFKRCGLPFNCVVGGDFQDKVWAEIQEWVEAASTQRALRDSKLGVLGHYYPGMLDMYTDLTLHKRMFGAHLEILEICDLAERVNVIQDEAIDAKVAEAEAMFHMPKPGEDRITAEVSPEELRWAAQVACALDQLVEDFDLGGLAYYYRGLNDNYYEKVAAAMVMGNSMLTARGIPCAGELDLKTCVTMFILEHFNSGGSFCELYLIDFEGGFIVVGHDGPGHLSIGHQKPILRGMKLFHGKSGHGVSVEFNVKNGPVTMLGLTQTHDGKFKFVVAEGESVPGPILQIGNTNTRVKFGDMPPEDFVKAWADTGNSHHFALGVGHQIGKIQKLAKLMDIDVDVVYKAAAPKA
ncbi:MAG: L-arabinose isomerase [Candidatus Promineifilaceae bacterium]|jgi:L-arabinose isomerase